MGPRQPCKFRQTDLRRALQALKSAGVKIDRVEIEDGKINVVVVKENGDEPKTQNPWDEVLR